MSAKPDIRCPNSECLLFGLPSEQKTKMQVDREAVRPVFTSVIGDCFCNTIKYGLFIDVNSFKCDLFYWRIQFVICEFGGVLMLFVNMTYYLRQ